MVDGLFLDRYFSHVFGVALVEVIRTTICATGAFLLGYFDKVEGKFSLAAMIVIAVPSLAKTIIDFLRGNKGG